ncbi:macrophage mannose receptor 1-like, partial [Clarias magur]
LTGAATALFSRKYIAVDQKMNWTDAQAYCRNKYADLAAFQSDDDQDRYKNDAKSHCNSGCWIGLSRNLKEKTFAQWSEGSNVTFTQWGSNERTNTMNYNCVYAEDDWYTDDCNNVRTFICYIWKPDLIVVKELKTWEGALKYCRTNYTDL